MFPTKYQSMKILFCLLLLGPSLSFQAHAQEETSEDEESAPEATSQTTARRTVTSGWSIGVSMFQWNETLRLQQGVVSTTDFANFNGLALTADKEFIYHRWGWSAGILVGSGRANGGGNSSVLTYEKNKVAFTMIGTAPRVFYRFSGRVNAGVTALVFMKNIDWPKDSPLQTIDSGRNLNAMPTLDLNIRLSKKFDFYQGMGPLAEGATLWRLGANYRF